MPTGRPAMGAGLGLRLPHLQQVLAELPEVPWFEVHICNFLCGGLNPRLLQQVAEHYALSFHSVSLNLGGCDPLDASYLAQLKAQVDELQPALVSDHACFCAHEGESFHDLLPLPYTEHAVRHLARRIDAVQNYLGREILIENLTRYTSLDPGSKTRAVMSEAEFLSLVCEQADCGLLLDLNNAWVNQCNLGCSVNQFLAQLPLQRVREIHLAGHQEIDGRLLDTHGSEVCASVWELYVHFCAQWPGVPCLLERDNNIPPLQELLRERRHAQRLYDGGLAAVSGGARREACDEAE